MTEQNEKFVSPSELAEQKAAIAEVGEYTARFTEEHGKRPTYHVITFGCQQNEADSEILSGLATEMGYTESPSPEGCELVVINTCAVREHAEKRALSITGQFKHLKAGNPDMKIAVCGCMVSQEHRCEEIKHRYPYVDILFGNDILYRFPSLLADRIRGGKRSFHIPEGIGRIAEGLPVKRKYPFSSYVSVMYGCNNFCTYCIVPYVRGRERSRRPDDVLREVESLISSGCREITLLGQNVNSYGKGLDEKVDFADLLERIALLPGDFTVRFMTSHPKDASKKLIDTIAKYDKLSPALHLPVQSGSSAILKKMNRIYTREAYLSLAAYAQEKIPSLVLTSDIIVGFPGETEEDFEETLSLMKLVRFDSVFSFIYSPRKGTPAASMPDQIPENVKGERLDRLMALQNEISKEKNDAYFGRVLRVLPSSVSKTDESMLSGRSHENKLVHFKGDPSQIGKFVNVKITRTETFALFGEITEEN